jgi:Tol biopolymer transport system component
MRASTRFLLLAATLTTSALAAQKVRTIPARVTEFGTIVDSTEGGSHSLNEASLSPNGEVIATTDDAGLSVYSRTGKTLIPLLSHYNESPVWSPAGDVIVTCRESEDGKTENLWAIRVDRITGKPSGQAWKVSPTPVSGYSPSFSPDGKMIAFARADSGARTSLVVVPLNGGPERELFTGQIVRRLRWADQASILFYAVSVDAKTARLYRVPATGGKVTLLQTIPYNDATLPMIAADGRSLIRFAEDSFPHGYIALDMAGKPTARLTYSDADWSADYSGRWQVAGVRESHPRMLRLLNLADGTTHDVLSTWATYSIPNWTADGKIAIAKEVNGQGILTVVDRNGQNARTWNLKTPLAMTPTLGQDRSDEVRISPDGRYAAYIGAGRSTLNLVDLTTGAQKRLASAILIRSTAWTDDSRAIRYVRQDSGNVRSVHEANVSGKDRLVRPFPVKETAASIWLISPHLAEGVGPTGAFLYSLDGKGDRRVMKGPVVGPGSMTTDARIIALRPGPFREATPEHRLTVFVNGDTVGRSLDISASLNVTGPIRMDPAGRAITFGVRNTGANSLSIYSQPVAGGEPKLLTTFESVAPVAQYTISPDGQWAAFLVDRPATYTLLKLDFGAIAR